MFADAQKVSGATIVNGGTSYKAGDIFTVVGGVLLWSDFPCVARLMATAVDGNGAVTAVALMEPGGYRVAPASANAVTGGNGTGCTLTLTNVLYWDNVAWIKPITTNLLSVLTQEVINKANANVDLTQPLPSANKNAQFDNTAPDRVQTMIDLVVQQVRGAIRIGRKIPLSVTPGTVPPSCLKHVINIVAWQLVLSTPTNVQFAVLTDYGAYAPFAAFSKDGLAYIDKLANGYPTEYPSDPDPLWQPAIADGYSQAADLKSYGMPLISGFPSLSLGGA